MDHNDCINLDVLRVSDKEWMSSSEQCGFSTMSSSRCSLNKSWARNRERTQPLTASVAAGDCHRTAVSSRLACQRSRRMMADRSLRQRLQRLQTWAGACCSESQVFTYVTNTERRLTMHKSPNT